MSKVLNLDKLPARWEAAEAILIACGAGEQDLRRFASAWRRLIMPAREPRGGAHPANPPDEPGVQVVIHVEKPRIRCETR
jgi:hypothetical protein